MDQHTRNFVERLIRKATKIEIISGEGDVPGTTERFYGARSIRALRMRLTRERCKGDRWARVAIDGQRCDEI
jgi:hypothetical protein